MRTIMAIVIAAALVTLAACGSDTTDAGTSASSADATTTVDETPAAAPSTPPTLSQEDAATRYLDIVRPYNEALEDLEQAVNAGESLDTVTALAEAVADANAGHIAELEDTAWPVEVQSAVDDLVTESSAAQDYWEQAAEADTYDEFIDAVVEAGEHDGVAAAKAIREELNLDEYDEGDYD